MDNVQTSKKLAILTSKCNDIKHEKKLLTDDFEGVKKYTIVSGIVSLACIIFYITIISWCLNSRNVSLKAFGRFLGPFIFAVFVAAFIIFTLKGFDFFINADTKYSKKVAKKLDKVTVTDRLNDLNSTIMRLEMEIDKMENDAYEHGEEATLEATGEVQEDTDNVINFFQDDDFGNDATIDISDMVVKRAEIQPRVLVDDVKVSKDEDVEKNLFSGSNNNIDDIFNGLDEFWEYEDEAESSSELWKQDTMKQYK